MKQVFSICFEMHVLIVQQNIKRAFIGIFHKYYDVKNFSNVMVPPTKRKEYNACHQYWVPILW